MNKRTKKIIIIVICTLLVIAFVLTPIAAVVVYEVIFGSRYETPSYFKLSAEDYEGLVMERSDFESDGVTLAGYKYYKESDTAKGLVILSHGMGGGGHNSLIPFADCFTSAGFYVFAYDARGNDNSEGDSVEGLPQGIIDLDNAINHAKTVAEYENLPIMLFGHSWGGYSVGNVLNLHPEVKAAVIVAGFNESEDLLSYQGKNYGGFSAGFVMPYLELYERIKFGKKYADLSAVEGMASTNAEIIVVHSKDDGTVPISYGYDRFYKEFCSSDRFKFVLYEDKGHGYLFYSDAAKVYREKLNADYKSYVESRGGEYNEKIKKEFMDKYLDKKQLLEPDPVLTEKILNTFEKCRKA